jgi:ELWxxDGT repeat protein
MAMPNWAMGTWFTPRGRRGLVRSLWRRQRIGRRSGAIVVPAIEQLDTRVALAADSFAGAPGEFVALGGLTAFVAEDKASGRELWVTDGTATGTRILKDVNPGKASSNPAELTVIGPTLFFVAENGAEGRELWKSDGTAAGTVLVKDIHPGKEMAYHWRLGKEVERSAWSDPQGLLGFAGKVYFAANDGVHGFELWSSDGTAQGTSLVKDIDPQSTSGSFGADGGVPVFVVGGRLMVRAADGLWGTDGTEAGTERLGPVTLFQDYSLPGNKVPHAFLGGKVVFAGDDGSGNGPEPWITDGTAAGTKLLADIKSATEGSVDFWNEPPAAFTAVGPIVYFSADDGVHGTELWRTDGTTAGTTMVKDIATGTSKDWDGQSRPDAASPSGIVPFAGGILFSADDGVNGAELWKSDGTAAGTALVKDLVSGSTKNWAAWTGKPRVPNSGRPNDITPFNGSAYFTANNGDQLWKTDGTSAGTVLVKDIDGAGNGSGGSGSYGALAVLNGALLFGANSRATGEGLWTSDGSAAGTVRVRDLAPRVTSVVGPAAGTRKIGDTITFRVEFSEPVTVTGKPSVPITVGTRNLQAVYQSGGGTKTLSFSYTVASGAVDSDGIVAGSSLVTSAGATIRNAFRTSARRDLPVSTLTGVLVDAIAPAVAGITPPANGDYKSGDTLTFVVRFTKGVVVTGTPSLQLTIGKVTRQAVFVSQASADSLRFEYRLQSSDPVDTNGIGLAKSIVLGGGTIRDAVGNAAILSFKVPSLAKVRVVQTPVS